MVLLLEICGWIFLCCVFFVVAWSVWLVFHWREQDPVILDRLPQRRLWACMKCGESCGPQRPVGGMCMDCQMDLQAYLQEVA